MHIINLSENEPVSLFLFESYHISLAARKNDEKARPVPHEFGQLATSSPGREV